MNRFKNVVAKLPKAARWTLLILVVVLITARALLPHFVLKYANHQLSTMKDYQGHIQDIDIALIRGAYKINELKLLKRTGKVIVPFIELQTADISIQWKALFEGSIVSEIEVTKPIINFVDGPTEAQSQKQIDSSWQDVVDHLVPFKINRLAIHDGEIHFRNLHSQPPIDLLLSRVEIEGQNFTNTKDLDDPLPASVSIRALAMNEAPLEMNLRMNALQRPMDFDYDADLKNLSLVKLNPFFLHYAALDVHRGSLRLASEMAAKNGRIVGYVKPTLKGMKVVETKKDIKKGPFSLVWQAIAGTIADIFQNDDKQAIRVPIDGTLRNPEVNTWAAVGSAFTHAFSGGLKPGVENRIGPNTPMKKAE